MTRRSFRSARVVVPVQAFTTDAISTAYASELGEAIGRQMSGRAGRIHYGNPLAREVMVMRDFRGWTPNPPVASVTGTNLRNLAPGAGARLPAGQPSVGAAANQPTPLLDLLNQ